MSANVKDPRAAKQAERREKKSAAAAEQEKKQRRYRRNAVIVAVILVVVIIGAALINSNLFYSNTTALTVGTTKYSPAEVSYFYRSSYNTMYQSVVSSYGDMASYLLDTSKPLSEQVYPFDMDGTKTWADAVAETARDDMVRITAFYDAAKNAGRTLDDAGQASIQQTLADYKQVAASNGFPDVNKFYSAYFGKGVTEKLVKKLQERITLASSYYQEILNSFTYTQDQLASYYSDHAAEMDYYNFYAYTLYPSMDQFSDVAEDEKDAKVHEAAEKIVAAGADADGFVEAVQEFAGDPDAISLSSKQNAGISINYRDWITDPARQPGDTTVLDVNGNTYALFFVSIDKNDYSTVDFRHILVMADEDENGEYSEEALTAAREKAEELLKLWKQNPTEDNFASLANANSEDSGSNTNGGLYEQVAKYTMVPGVNDFLFADGRTAGDTDVVLGKSSGYTGYHVMYYVGENTRNCDILAENAMRDEDFTAASNEITAGYTIQEGASLRFVSEP